MDDSSEIRLLQKKERENRQKLHILLEISRLVSSLLHLPEVLDGIIELLVREYRFYACSIRLLDSNGNLRIMSQKGLSDSFIKRAAKHPKPGSCLMECFQTGKIIIVNDVEQADSLNANGLVLAEGTKSFALTPISVEAKVIGVLVTTSKRKDYFHERYSDAIYIIATQIGQAIRTAQLYDEIYNFSRKLEKKVQERTAQLKESHERLLKAERHAALGRLANRIAHEFRNSLTVIGGFARRLHEKIPDNDSNKKYVDIIAEEVMSLERKVAQIIEIVTEDQGDIATLDDELH